MIEDSKKNFIKRLNIIIGQLNAVKEMIGKDDDCDKILLQMKALSSAFKNVKKLIFKNALKECSLKKFDDKKVSYLLKNFVDE
jgi:DNA-binding FrmR family transcriptional regulator